MLEHRQVEMLFDDLVEGVFERAFNNLVGIRQRNHLSLIQVVLFVSAIERSGKL